ncbi:MAG: hypothetical protein H6608_07415 [Flavobacteriales bacterium]|nr:hypothetical protein [Flavobacteriales bacterium]
MTWPDELVISKQAFFAPCTWKVISPKMLYQLKETLKTTDQAKDQNGEAG